MNKLIEFKSALSLILIIFNQLTEICTVTIIDETFYKLEIMRISSIIIIIIIFNNNLF